MEQKLHSAPILHTGMRNALARARQMTELTWTVVRDTMPGFRRTVTGERELFFYQPGEVYRGIPYSSVWESGDYVGSAISLGAFVSALQNPNSVLYTENLWNRTGEPKAVTRYGSVCSKFAAYVLGIDASYNCQHFHCIDGMRKIADHGCYSPEVLMRCDILLNPKAHTAVVTDILSDDDGNIVYIEVSEETTKPHMRRQNWEPEAFFAHFAQYDVYRYDRLDSVPYEKSAFVNVFDEDAPLDDRKYDVLNRRGDGTNFVCTPGLCVTHDILTPERSWTGVQVLRDGTPVWSAALHGEREFSVPSEEPGYYEVFLTDADGRKSRPSRYCAVSFRSEAKEVSPGRIALVYSCTPGRAVYAQPGWIGDSVYLPLAGSGTEEIRYDPAAVTMKIVRIGYKTDFGIIVGDFMKI